MKSFQSITRMALFGLVFSLCLSCATLRQKPPVKINLISDKVSYEPEEPIKIQIRVLNNNKNFFGQKKPLIARRGFFDQDFHLALTIIDPQGLVVAKKHFGSVTEPVPPYRVGDRFLVPVEIIPPDGESVYVMKDARKYYYLGETHGWYSAVVRAPLETFTDYAEDATGELYAELFAKCSKAYNPLSSNKMRFEILPAKPAVKATLKVQVNLLTIMDGSGPTVSKSLLENADVRLYRLTEIPADYQPVIWKLYRVIWNNVKPQQSRLTHSNGAATFSGVKRDDYLILARHPDFSHEILAGSVITKADLEQLAGKTTKCTLSVIRKADGSMVPGKTVRSKITDLMITEPEYIEWDSNRETYPFVFITGGSGTVTTYIFPPEGFKVDYQSQTAQVTDEMQMILFRITDVGSKWEETKVKYKINYKSKTEEIESSIGIKLSKELAKKKGVGPYGTTAVPGPFKGGKKVSYQKKIK
ncbi:MAG: hypothetical protein AMK69_27140 [Nitrospira bacterium SG8_3]|nr:MAG: hypothetical protein AMK69_27140 [Nitrospira bacterium SG8_3]